MKTKENIAIETMVFITKKTLAEVEKELATEEPNCDNLLGIMKSLELILNSIRNEVYKYEKDTNII